MRKCCVSATAEPQMTAEVVLTGPGRGNAMGPDFWRELPQVFDALAADEGVRAVVLRGEGKHFSYGLDLMSMMGKLAHAVGFVCGAEHPAAVALQAAADSGSDKDIKAARKVFLRLKPTERRASLAMLED